jgi:hypothetical protein
MNNKIPPYDTGKVKIGFAYEPQRPRLQSADEERLQNALLGLYDNKQERKIKRYVGLVLFVIALALVVSYAPR